MLALNPTISRTVLVLLTIFFCISLVSAYSFFYRQYGAHTDLDVPGDIDFGVVTPTQHFRTIKIENRTPEAFTISRVVSSCGCTIIDLKTPKLIEPGDSLLCEVGFDGVSLAGKIHKRIVFHTDQFVQTESGIKDVAYVTNILAFVEASRLPIAIPSVLNFGRFGTWESPAGIVRVCNQGTQTLHLKELKPVASGIHLSLQETKNGKAIQVSLDGKEVGDKIDIEQLIDTSQGQIQFRILGERKSEPYLQSPLIVFHPQSDSSLCSKTVTICHPAVIASAPLSISVPGWLSRIVGAKRTSEMTTDVTFEISPRNTIDVPEKRGVLTISDQSAIYIQAPFLIQNETMSLKY